MNLVVDLGNSSAKAGFFEGDFLKSEILQISADEILPLVKAHHPENLIIGSVGENPLAFIKDLPVNIHCLIADHSLKFPIEMLYQSPKTLGIDRLAAVVGANYLYPGQDCLVIDIGTCITYDFIDSKGVYQGGSISPGIKIKFKALHNFTAKLPLVQTTDNSALIGKDTTQSIQSGVIFGTLAEIEGMMVQYANVFPGFKTIICGGDAKFFETKIKAPIFVIPELVLVGLNRILQHNVHEI